MEVVNNRLHRAISEPDREYASIEQRWKGSDKGLIHCWELGRRKASDDPELAKRAKDGELPLSHWKGGFSISENPKLNRKYASLFYLAELQGLRGEDLDIDTDSDTEIVCTRTNVRVTFTPDVKKYGKSQP